MKNMRFLGFKYFRLKTKKDFSQRQLLSALNYSPSGASYIMWKNGSRPGKERMKEIAFLISNMILEKDFISVDLTSDNLLHDSIQAIIEAKKDNNLEDIIIKNLSFEEKKMINIYRQSELEEQKMFDTFTELIIDQIRGNKRLNSEFQTIKYELLDWINEKLIS